MSVRLRPARLILFMILLSLPSATATAIALSPKQVPSQASLICEVSPEVKQGEKGTIRGSGFTPNADVDVTFNRPDGTSSNHTGKADAAGVFNGTFTVERDRPEGAWNLILIDKPSGRSIFTPFTVTPVVAPAATSSPEPAAPLIAKPRKPPGRSQPDAASGGRIWEYLERWLWMIAAFLGFAGIFIALLIWWLLKRNPVDEVEQPDWEKDAPPTGPMPPTPPPDQSDFSEDERPTHNEDQPPENE